MEETVIVADRDNPISVKSYLSLLGCSNSDLLLVTLICGDDVLIENTLLSVDDDGDDEVVFVNVC